MAEASHIEPYNRERVDYHRSHSRDLYPGSRGSSSENRKEFDPRTSHPSSLYNRHSQERHREENKYEYADQPPSILKRRDVDYERQYREDFRGRDYSNEGRHVHMSNSRSPHRDGWGSGREETSPRIYAPHKSPSSPLRGRSMSPHGISPSVHHRVPPPPAIVTVEDPVERRSLLAQLDELKHKLHYHYGENTSEVEQLRASKENEIKDILSKKDALVEESHHRIQRLKMEIEDEERKAEQIKEENILMQKNHANRVEELQRQIESSQARLDQVKHEHEESVREQIRQQDEEKRILRDDYEKLIDQIRQEYQATREELKDILNDRNNLVEEAKNKLADLKQYYADEMDNLKKEVDHLQDSIQTSKKLNEKQNQEFDIARKTNKNLQNENYNLQREITKLTKDAEKYEIENEVLRSKIMRLDKLVYGKGKSPFKKFYN